MPSVLVTGASRGIGRAGALRLAASGWTVLAGVRSEEAGAKLAGEHPNLVPVRLDVTDPGDLAALPERVRNAAAGGRLDAVVNNAGIVVGGPLEALALDDLRRQLEVNVVAPVAVCQAVLPLLRESRGRVVFMSSVSGLVSSPMLGAYGASKFAIEAIADALRIELRPWRIAVCLIEPGNIDTDIWRDAGRTLDEVVAATSPEHLALYGKHIDGMRRAIPVLQRTASDADQVAAAIEKALTARRPRARYLVGAGGRLQGTLLRRLPRAVRDTGLRIGTGIPRRA